MASFAERVAEVQRRADAEARELAQERRRGELRAMIQRLRSKGHVVTLTEDGANINVSPRPTPEMIELLKANKTTLLEVLKAAP